MAIAREDGRTKICVEQDGKMVMCDYSPLTSSKITYAIVQRGVGDFSCLKKERPSVKVTAWIEDYGEQHLSLLTCIEMLLRMSSAHI